MAAHAHCHACGAAYEVMEWPRSCSECGQMTWKNPLPVAVVLVPVVEDGEEVGLLGVQRAIEPKGLALPGGFIESLQEWRGAGAREVMEETGIEIDPERIREVRVISAPAPDETLLVFGLADPIDASKLDGFVQNDETDSIEIIPGPTEKIVLSLHALVVEEYFAGAYR